jgi:hypothetical protein
VQVTADDNLSWSSGVGVSGVLHAEVVLVGVTIFGSPADAAISGRKPDVAELDAVGVSGRERPSWECRRAVPCSCTSRRRSGCGSSCLRSCGPTTAHGLSLAALSDSHCRPSASPTGPSCPVTASAPGRGREQGGPGGSAPPPRNVDRAVPRIVRTSSCRCPSGRSSPRQQARPVDVEVAEAVSDAVYLLDQEVGRFGGFVATAVEWHTPDATLPRPAAPRRNCLCQWRSA